MSALHRLVTVLKNVNYAYRLITEQEARTAKRVAMLQELDTLSLKRTCGNALLYLSEALKLAHTLGIQLGEGYAPSQCKASLPKASWRYPVDPTVDPANYGVLSYFLITDVPAIIAELESIDAYADSVQEAVVRCVMYSRRAGVL